MQQANLDQADAVVIANAALHVVNGMCRGQAIVTCGTHVSSTNPMEVSLALSSQPLNSITETMRLTKQYSFDWFVLTQLAFLPT